MWTLKDAFGNISDRNEEHLIGNWRSVPCHKVTEDLA